jgi:molecular chaperone DnaK (HSP70)
MSLTEPEAAAVHTSVDAPRMFEENEIMMICDAGGGTTDLSVMRITGVCSGVVSLQQLDTVFGRSIGSTAIDTDFGEYVLEHLEQANSSFNLGLDPDEAAWSMMKSREYQGAKCDIGLPDVPPLFLVPVPGLNSQFTSEQFGLAQGAMRFPKSILERMFDTQIEKLTSLVDKHLTKFQNSRPSEQIAHLVLSGGLGNSAYVQQQLKAKYAFGMSRFACARNMQVHVAPDPQLAVCKGIVTDRVRKLNTNVPVITWKCARASYGTLAKTLYNKQNPEHIGKQTFQDPLNGKYYIQNSIVWFIKKVSNIPTPSQPLNHQLRATR